MNCGSGILLKIRHPRYGRVHINRIDQDVIAGWAVEMNVPKIPIKLSVYVNGAYVTAVPCGEVRADGDLGWISWRPSN